MSELCHPDGFLALKNWLLDTYGQLLNHQTILAIGLDLSTRANNMRKERPGSFVYILTSW